MNKNLSQRAIVLMRAAIAGALLILGLVIFQVLASTKPIVPEIDADQLHQRVRYFTAQPVPVQRQWIGYGTAEAINSANIPARVTATVTRVLPEAREGTSVIQGQVLVELDDSDFANQLKIAEQNLSAVDARLAELDNTESSLKQQLDIQTRDMKLAQDELARIKEMFGAAAANQKDLDASERAALSSERNKIQIEESLSAIGPRRNQLQAEKAGLVSSADIARKNLDRCLIKSPIDGVIQEVDVEVGENLAPGQRVARVVDVDHIQTPLSLSASARSHVRVGDQVKLVSTADADLSWDGEVTRIAPEDDAATRTFAAYVEVPADTSDDKTKLAPGVFVSGVVMESNVLPRIAVPRRSIRTERVMLIRDNLIHSSEVAEAFAYEGTLPTFGLPDKQWAVLASGVEPGDRVVLNPTRSLSDGQQVQPVPVGEDDAGLADGGGVQ